MKRYIAIMLLIGFSLGLLNALPANWTQYYFTFQIQDRAELHTLTDIISIDNVKGKTVWAYANDDEWAAFNKLGYSAQILPNPGSLIEPVMAYSTTQMRDWVSYPTYETYVATLNAFATNYPNLCQIVDAGVTVGGRTIYFARISDNIATHEAEPEVMYTSSVHGDETTGFILTLRLIDYLLSNYATSTQVQNLVNNLEIWINPLANPDGTYYGGNSSVNGARRYNLNGIDINRNFPDPGGADGGTIQPETQIMMDLANAHHFVLSANYHGGAEVLNYPWDTFSYLHVDNDWLLSVCQNYANTVHTYAPAGYLDDLNNGVTNGYAWYEVNNGRQDWMTYYKHCREITMEISNTKLLPASQLDAYWNYQYRSMLGYLENALYGIQGIVTNGSGTPLAATISILGRDDAQSVAVTDPANGDYIRMLPAGTYTVVVSAAGYPNRTFTNVVVNTNQKTTLNVIMGEISETQTIALSSGWNLISLRVNPADCNLPAALSSIQSNLVQVKNTSAAYAPGVNAWFNTLTELTPGFGYWVNVSAACNLSVTGTAINPATTSIDLVPGWNLVAYLPSASQAVGTALASISPYLQEVKFQNQTYIPGSGANTLTQMSPNNGYYIKVSAACSLTYPAAAK
jgi:hypothetical protein